MIVAGHLQVAGSAQWRAKFCTVKKDRAFPIAGNRSGVSGEFLCRQGRRSFQRDSERWHADLPANRIACVGGGTSPCLAGWLKLKIIAAQVVRQALPIDKRAGRERVDRAV